MDNSSRYAILSDEQLQRIHAASERFEKALQNGEPICIEDCIAAVTEEIRSPLFHELLAIELERRLPGDRSAQLAEYHARFPERLSDIERVFEELAEALAADDLTEQIGEPEAERDPVSVSVPGYEICEVLGRGAMGVVYKAAI